MEVAGEIGHRRVMSDVLVAVGHHRAPTVPPTVPDDVHLSREKGVGRTHDRADVEVVLPVLDRHVKVVSAAVEVGDDGLHRPVPIPVHDVAPVTFSEQSRVVLLTARPRTGPGPQPNLGRPMWHRVVRRPAVPGAVLSAVLGAFPGAVLGVVHRSRLGAAGPPRGSRSRPEWPEWAKAQRALRSDLYPWWVMHLAPLL